MRSNRIIVVQVYQRRCWPMRVLGFKEKLVLNQSFPCTSHEEVQDAGRKVEGIKSFYSDTKFRIVDSTQRT